MAALQVEIVTPTRVAWQGEASSIRAPGAEGELGILPGHASMVTLLRAGVVVVEGAASHRFVVGPGFAEVGGGRVSLLVDSTESADGSDKEAARAALDAAFKALATTNAGTPAADEAQRQVDMAVARLSA
jgi:F-type H+-transporting ATPase subunit epsilon